jgi:hypothetical protein
LRKWKANKKNENKAAREKSGRKWRAYYYYLQSLNSLSFTNTNLWSENTRNLSPLSHKISLHTCKYLLCPASASTSKIMGVWDLRFFTQVRKYEGPSLLLNNPETQPHQSFSNILCFFYQVELSLCTWAPLEGAGTTCQARWCQDSKSSSYKSW